MKRLINLSFLSVIFFSCEPGEEFIPENPFDPQNSTYTPPSVTIVSGPQNNGLITSSTVSFGWSGNLEGMLYRYFLDGKVLREWDTQTSAVIEYLDEGYHEFGLQGKYPTGDMTDTLGVIFNVDAVKGPSLLFSPRKKISIPGDTISFDILAEEVSGLAGTSFTLTFDNNLIKVDSIIAGQYMESNSESIFYVDTDNASGRIELVTALIGSSEPAFSGTASLAKIYVSILANGTNEIKFDGSETFRTLNNEKIDIITAIGAIIDQN
jgi:hypothetical protein